MATSLAHLEADLAALALDQAAAGGDSGLVLPDGVTLADVARVRARIGGAPVRAVEVWRPDLEPQVEMVLGAAVPAVRVAARQPALRDAFHRQCAGWPPMLSLGEHPFATVPVAAPLAPATRQQLLAAGMAPSECAALEHVFAERMAAFRAASPPGVVYTDRQVTDVLGTEPVCVIPPALHHASAIVVTGDDDARREPIAAVTLGVPLRDPHRHTQVLLPLAIKALVRALQQAPLLANAAATVPRDTVWEWAYYYGPPAQPQPRLYLRYTTRTAVEARYHDTVRVWRLHLQRRAADESCNVDDLPDRDFEPSMPQWVALASRDHTAQARREMQNQNAVLVSQ